MPQDSLPIRSYDTCTFLTPVLEGIKAEIGQFGSLFMTINRKNA